MGRKSLSRFRLLTALLATGFLFAACGSSANTAATNESSDTTAGEESSDTTAGEESGLPDLEGRKITIAVENAYLPFNYIEKETGEPGGWDYDALAEMCKRLNCEPEFVPAAWDGMIQGVADGQYDMAADGITITTERAEIVDFSDGYLAVEQRILVAADNEDIVSIDDLRSDEEALVGAQTGTTNYDVAVTEVGDDRVKGFETFGFAVQALINGDVSAVILDENAGQGYVGENAETIKIVGDALSSEQLGLVFGKGSDLVDPFNQVIKEMKDDQTMDKLSAKYFGVDFALTQDDIEG